MVFFFPPPKFQRFPIHLGLKVENPEPGSIPQNHHWLSMARRMHEAAGLPSLGWGRVLQDGGLEFGVLFCLMIVNGMKLNHAERRRREEPGAWGRHLSVLPTTAHTQPHNEMPGMWKVLHKQPSQALLHSGAGSRHPGPLAEGSSFPSLFSPLGLGTPAPSA